MNEANGQSSSSSSCMPEWMSHHRDEGSFCLGLFLFVEVSWSKHVNGAALSNVITISYDGTRSKMIRNFECCQIVRVRGSLIF